MGRRTRVTPPALNHWDRFHRHWRLLAPPLRPNAEIVAAFSAALGEPSGRCLLLGVTPELAFDDRDLVAVDRSGDMIIHLWPGDTPRRRVVQGAWQQTPFPNGSFQAALGDGSLNVLTYPAGHDALYRELVRLVRPGSPVAVQIYATPDVCETVDDLASSVRAGAPLGSFHAFKFRLAMALTAQRRDPNIAVTAVLDAFEQLFPDRARLATRTGWPIAHIDTIDIYRGSWATYSFPTLAAFKAVVPAEFFVQGVVSSGDYDLAARCPLLLLRRE